MPLTLTAYVTAQTIRDFFVSPEHRNDAVKILRNARVSRVVLESYRTGCVVDEALLATVRDHFVAAGFEALGGIMPLHGEGFGKHAEGRETRQPVFCFCEEETVAVLEQEIRKLARVFDTVVFDDGFFTSCRGEVCMEACVDGECGAARRSLLARVAERWINAARAENMRVRVIVKFPQYYDRYHRFGYDASRFPSLFDAVWQGTETRNPATPAYGYVEPYEGYFNLRWMRLCAGDRLNSAWFDSLDCDDQLFYEQAITTSLGAPDDITIFSYDKELFSSSRVMRVAASLPKLNALREAAVQPRGVHAIKPANSDAGTDHFIFDYLGMMGVPLVAAQAIDSSMRCIFVPAHALAAPEVVRAIPRALMAGRHVILTFGALAGLAAGAVPDERGGPRTREILEFFGYRARDIWAAPTLVDSFTFEGKTVACEEPFHVAGDLAPTDAAVLAWANLADPEDGRVPRVPFVTARSFSSGGRAIVWNLGTFGPTAFDIREQLNVPVRSDLLSLPKLMLDHLRRTATGALGFTIKAPARVATFLFARHLVVMNYELTPAEVQITGLHWDTIGLLSDSPKTVATGDTIYVAGRSFALLPLKG